MKKSELSVDMPIVGFPIAAPLSGKDTAQSGLARLRPKIAILHMSMLLKITIEQNEKYKSVVTEGGLLPPEEAFKAFRRGFLEIVSGVSKEELPHIFANGASREEFETRHEIELLHRRCPGSYQVVAFRFIMDSKHILQRAQERTEQLIATGQKPRKEDKGDTPIARYNTFQENMGPVLSVIERKGGIVIPIDANQGKEDVLRQICSVYDSVKSVVSV